MSLRGLLVVVNLLLLAALGWYWSNASLKWTPPAPVLPALSAYVASGEHAANADFSSFGATLERPLFSADRRPIPRHLPAADDKTFDAFKLVGLFGSGDDVGALLLIDEGVVRVRLGSQVGGWTLIEVSPGAAVFVRGIERREVRLVKPASSSGTPGPSVRPARAESSQPAQQR